MLDFPTCSAFTRTWEGGLVDNPRDSGGITNLGITILTLTRWREDHGLSAATADDIRALTWDLAEPIYGTYYWNPILGDQLPAGIDLLMYDFGVTASPAQSTRCLQTVLGFTGDDVDGWLGSQTLGAVLAVNDVASLGAKLAAEHTRYYHACKNAIYFERGWDNREAARLTQAKAMWGNA